MLQDLEKKALLLVFRGEDSFSKSVRERLDEAKCLCCEDTGVGFYSTIVLNKPFLDMPELKIWDYNFSHPDFPYGGSFICSILSEVTLELEAVTFGGENWPKNADVNLFTDLETSPC